MAQAVGPAPLFSLPSEGPLNRKVKINFVILNATRISPLVSAHGSFCVVEYETVSKEILPSIH